MGARNVLGIALIAGAAMAAALPSPAPAGQIVYQHKADQGGSQLWVMNEDGSGQHAWLDPFTASPPSGGTRFVTASDPEISADGRRVVFTTQTTANKAPNGLAT